VSVTQTPEYKRLALDSSNDMIRYDSRWVLGEYEEAALHIRQAGFARHQMGQLAFDAGQLVRAASDWLSSAACFYLVPDLDRMREAFGRVREIDRAGHIPAERRDIRAAIVEREEQIRTLEGKLARFWHDHRQIVGPMRTVSQQALDFLLRQVRELPGFPHLHAEISYHALNLGQRELAERSLEWASKFDPGSPHLAALRASQAFAHGDSVRAVQLAREGLIAHPEMGYLRVLLAQALAFRAGPHAANWKAADWEAAIEVLRPLLEEGSTDPLEVLTAISLAATLHHGLGHESEYRRLLGAFDSLAVSIQNPAAQVMAARLRRDLPQVFPQPGSNGARPSGEGRQPLAEPDYSTVRRLFAPPSPLVAAAVG
jgi:hypothetical protein